MRRPFTELGQFNFEFKKVPPKPEKLSQKDLDIFARGILESNPDLRQKSTEVFKRLQDDEAQLPVIHFTNKAVKTERSVKPTGFVERIKSEGLKARHTNVAVFVERGKTNSIAQPQYYIEKPEEFIKSAWLMLKRYEHHGIRTNKEALGENKDQGKGVPTMLLIEGDAKMEKASDYDDHYILDEKIPGNKIFAELNLESFRPYRENMPTFLRALLETIDKHSQDKSAETVRVV